MYFLTQHTFIVGKDMYSTGDEVMSPVDKTVCLLRVAFVEKKWRENNMSGDAFSYKRMRPKGREGIGWTSKT